MHVNSRPISESDAKMCPTTTTKTTAKNCARTQNANKLIGGSWLLITHADVLALISVSSASTFACIAQPICQCCCLFLVKRKLIFAYLIWLIIIKYQVSSCIRISLWPHFVELSDLMHRRIQVSLSMSATCNKNVIKQQNSEQIAPKLYGLHQNYSIVRCYLCLYNRNLCLSVENVWHNGTSAISLVCLAKQREIDIEPILSFQPFFRL